MATKKMKIAAEVAAEVAAEKVAHPSYYGGKDSPHEVIKVIEGWGLSFSSGSALKYLARAGKKTPDSLTDLRKAQWYLRRVYDQHQPLRTGPAGAPVPTPRDAVLAWKIGATSSLAKCIHEIAAGTVATALLHLWDHISEVEEQNNKKHIG